MPEAYGGNDSPCAYRCRNGTNERLRPHQQAVADQTRYKSRLHVWGVFRPPTVFSWCRFLAKAQRLARRLAPENLDNFEQTVKGEVLRRTFYCLLTTRRVAVDQVFGIHMVKIH